MRLTWLEGVALLAVAVGVSGCGERDWGKRGLGGTSHASLVTEAATKPADVAAFHDETSHAPLAAADKKAAALQVTPATTAVSGQVTFQKDRLFDREFLYGFDLQYTSQTDPVYQLTPQAQAQGHVPCAFRRLGDELQLVADQRRLYESDIDHPELLLATYKIVAEDDKTLTVTFERSGLVLNEVANGKGADAPKEEWVRSFTYVPEGDYLMQESALLLKDGSVQTFLESVFPRANVVPDGYTGLENSAQYEPLAARYRFLSAETVYVPKTVDGATVRVQTSFANRILVGPSGTIDWYVTANAPDNMLPVMKSGIEGWNRYFRPQLGRDVMRFLGRLPAGVNVGDPRYNVVNFDSVAQAGAAYESQASDPLTGLQSHSIIYLPYAWYNIGTQLWKLRADTGALAPEAELLAQISPKGADLVFGKGKHIIACVRSTDDVQPTASQMVGAILGGNVPTYESLDLFSKRLMMSTLFHEVGHSLGFAHEFKGSLSFDGTLPEGPANATTWSVMDYNYYQNEQLLFNDIGGSDGPALEYDRQGLSQLYNHGKDVAATDKVIPACADDEADTTTNGVDPLCNRYDAENDPSVGTQHAWVNLAAATGATGVEAKTLAEQLALVQQGVPAKFAGLATADALTKAATDLGNKAGDVATYFLSSGAQSVRVNLNENSKSLRLWQDGIPVDEAAFRTRYLTVLTAALALKGLPDAPQAALKALEASVGQAASASAGAGADAAAKNATATAAMAAFDAAASAKISTAVAKLRKTAYAFLGFDLKNPFALALTAGGPLTHFEDLAAQTLAVGVTRGLGGDAATLARLDAERQEAAKDLLTFQGLNPAFDTAVAQLKAVIANGQQAGDTRSVAAARALLKTLTGAPG